MVKSGLDVIFDICLYGIRYHSIIPLSLFLDATKNISLIKIQSITKNHIRDLFQFISSTSTFVTQKLGSRNDLIPIHKFVSKGNFSSDTFSS